MNQEGSKNIRLIIAKYPLHTIQHQTKTYNLYREDLLAGIQQNIPLKYPCVRQGCMTTCYFEGKNATASTMEQPCPNCGHISDKIYLDIGFKMFIHQHFEYIDLNSPLHVQINPFTKQFFFPPKNMNNSLKSQLSDYIVQTLMKEIAFDQISILYKKTLDFWKIGKQLSQIFAPQYQKKNFHLYNFCKYQSATEQTIRQTFLLLFLHPQQHPIKVSLKNQQLQPIFKHQTYLSHTNIGFISQLNTFIFHASSKEGSKFYASCLDIHFNSQEEFLILTEQQQWRDPVARYYGSLVVDQQSKSFHMVGGYDYQKFQISDHLISFVNCRWEHLEGKYFFKADKKSVYNAEQPEYAKTKISMKNSSFLLSKKTSQKRVKNKELISLGGVFTDYSFFGSGNQSYYKKTIKHLAIQHKSNEQLITYETLPSSLSFPHHSYIVIELPHFTFSSFNKNYKHHALVMGGRKEANFKIKDSTDSDVKEIILLDTTFFKYSQKLPQQFYFGHLLTSNKDHSQALLFDPLTKKYYIRAVYPLQEPLKISNYSYIHYLIIQFNLQQQLLRVIPGQMSIY